MATTIKEFIEYLKTLPPDTEVGVICGYTSGYSYDTKEVPLEIDENTCYTDFTGNPNVKEEHLTITKGISPLASCKYLFS